MILSTLTLFLNKMKIKKFVSEIWAISWSYFLKNYCFLTKTWCMLNEMTMNKTPVMNNYSIAHVTCNIILPNDKCQQGTSSQKGSHIYFIILLSTGLTKRERRIKSQSSVIRMYLLSFYIRWCFKLIQLLQIQFLVLGSW